MHSRLTVLVFLLMAQVGLSQNVNPFKMPSPEPASPPVEAPPASTSLDSFQFNGVMEIRGVTRISLYDTKENRNFWVNEDELGEFGISFRRYDDDSETVVIAQGGLTKKLALNKVSIEPLKITPNRQNNVEGVTATANAVVNNRPGGARVETDDEARARIQRVAEEIRRRRAERRQQLEQRNRNSGN